MRHLHCVSRLQTYGPCLSEIGLARSLLGVIELHARIMTAFSDIYSFRSKNQILYDSHSPVGVRAFASELRLACAILAIH